MGPSSVTYDYLIVCLKCIRINQQYLHVQCFEPKKKLNISLLIKVDTEKQDLKKKIICISIDSELSKTYDFEIKKCNYFYDSEYATFCTVCSLPPPSPL